MAKVYCLQVRGANLDDYINSVLLASAQIISFEGFQKVHVQGPAIIGSVETKGKRVSLGGISGQQFEAEIALITHEGSTHEASVSYVVPDRSLAGSLADHVAAWAELGATITGVDDSHRDLMAADSPSKYVN